MAAVNRICVRGRLDGRWTDRLGGLAVYAREDGTTELIGTLSDQAELFGVIIRIRDLGLPLLSLGPLAEPNGHSRTFPLHDVTKRGRKC